MFRMCLKFNRATMLSHCFINFKQWEKMPINEHFINRCGDLWEENWKNRMLSSSVNQTDRSRWNHVLPLIKLLSPLPGHFRTSEQFNFIYLSFFFSGTSDETFTRKIRSTLHAVLALSTYTDLVAYIWQEFVHEGYLWLDIPHRRSYK